MLRISSPLRKVSRGHSSCHLGAKGQRNGRSSYRVIERGESRMFTNLKLAKYPLRVKPSMVWQRDNQSCRTRTGETGSMREYAGGFACLLPQPFQPPGPDPHAGWCGRGAACNGCPLSRFVWRGVSCNLAGKNAWSKLESLAAWVIRLSTSWACRSSKCKRNLDRPPDWLPGGKGSTST